MIEHPGTNTITCSFYFEGKLSMTNYFDFDY